MNTIEAFLLVAGLGGFISATTWFFTHRLTKRWWWRVALCLLLGASVAPAYIPGGWGLWPASLVLLNLLDRTDPFLSLIFGGLPVLLCASVLFSIWSLMIRRKARIENRFA